MLLLQGRVCLAFLRAVTAVLFYHIAMDTWNDSIVARIGRRFIAVLTAVTAKLLHHRAIDICTESFVVSSEWRGYGVSVCSSCNTVTLQCYGYML